MRRLAILFVLAGCNKIFGLDELRELDGGTDPNDRPRFHLVHQIASTRADSPGVIATPIIEQAPLPVGTTVRVSSDTKLLEDAVYDAQTGEAEILISDPFTKRWLVELTLPGQAPLELSWTPDGENTLLTVPVIGRLDRGMMPASAGWDIQPSPSSIPPPPMPGTFSGSHIFTTGVFLDAATGTSPNNAKLDIQTTRFDGPTEGAPDASRGDHAIVVDYTVAVGAPCFLTARGYAGFPPPALVANAQIAPNPQPIWQVPPITTMRFQQANPGPVGIANRLNAALGTRTGGGSSTMEFGFTANDQIFGFSGPPRGGAPSPLLFSLASCNLDATEGSFIIPTDLAKFPQLVYGNLINARTSDGVSLVSSIATLDLRTNDSLDLTIDFGVPFVATATLSDGTNVFGLTGDNDNIAVAPGAGTLALELQLEPVSAGFDPVFDYLEVVVFELKGPGLSVVRRYATTDIALDPVTRELLTPVTIDRSLFVEGHRYVFALSTVRGVPNAATGHFDAITYPHAITTIFTRTILIPTRS
jgi:hypothetical protein